MVLAKVCINLSNINVLNSTEYDINYWPNESGKPNEYF